MRVLGIDPGLTRCGVGVVDVEPNRTATLVDVVVLRSPAELDTPRRLARIADDPEPMPRPGQPLEKERARAVDVLKFVDEDMRPAGTELGNHRRMRFEQGAGAHDEIAEVEPSLG